MTEMRWNDRVATEYEALLIARWRRFAGTVRDVSQRGVFVQTSSAFNPRELVVLDLRVRDSAEETQRFLIPGMVVRQNSEGMGLFVDTLTPCAAEGLTVLMEYAQQRIFNAENSRTCPRTFPFPRALEP